MGNGKIVVWYKIQDVFFLICILYRVGDIVLYCICIMFKLYLMLIFLL